MTEQEINDEREKESYVNKNSVNDRKTFCLVSYQSEEDLRRVDRHKRHQIEKNEQSEFTQSSSDIDKILSYDGIDQLTDRNTADKRK